VVNLVLNVVLYAAFARLGAWGIPLAISLANIAGVGLLALTLRHRIGSLHLVGTANAFCRSLLASAVLAVVGYAVWRGLDGALGRSLAAQLVSVTAALVAGGAAYLGAARLLRVRELSALLSLRRSRSGGD
jgi:putative peptidoglycan lipid II flippase